MRFLIQWAKAVPQDWEVVEAAHWAQLAKLAGPVPVGGEVLDQRARWISGICIQGVRTTEADHYHVAPTPDGGCVLTHWADDFVDWPVGHRWAIVHTFEPLQPDPDLGGAINTRQTRTIYAEPEALKRLQTDAPTDTFLPWSQFVPPPADETIHGIWMTDALFEQHRQTRSLKGWRDALWTEHLPVSEREADGSLKIQADLGRKSPSRFTITYIQRDTDRPNATQPGINETALERDSATAAAVGITMSVGSSKNWTFTSPADDPNIADWPSGDYRTQWDVNALDANVFIATTFFVRVNGALSSTEEFGQNTTDVTTTGLHLRSLTKDFAAGLAADRYVTKASFTNSNAHGNASATLNLNTADSFADGPWVEGGGPIEQSHPVVAATVADLVKEPQLSRSIVTANVVDLTRQVQLAAKTVVTANTVAIAKQVQLSEKAVVVAAVVGESHGLVLLENHPVVASVTPALSSAVTFAQTVAVITSNVVSLVKQIGLIRAVTSSAVAGIQKAIAVSKSIVASSVVAESHGLLLTQTAAVVTSSVPGLTTALTLLQSAAVSVLAVVTSSREFIQGGGGPAAKKTYRGMLSGVGRLLH